MEVVDDNIRDKILSKRSQKYKLYPIRSRCETILFQPSQTCLGCTGNWGNHFQIEYIGL